jgi:hypothetical protein
VVRGFDSIPDEILSLILDHHFDITRHASLKTSEPQSKAPRLQFQYELQMSLCEVSKRFNHLISYLFRRNGLIRVTCLLDPHLDFYYLLPTICHSERTDMFQIPCPHLSIDLSHGMSDPLLVRSIICASTLPTVLDLARLHHTAGCTLLPSLYDIQPLNSRMRIGISGDTTVGPDRLASVTSSITRHLPALQKVVEAEGESTYELEEQTQESPQTLSLWAAAFQIARTHCVSTDVNRRRLGLQILRYLLLSMMVVINPWDPNKARSQHLGSSLRMMALSSAVLIDALVVEPNMLEEFYGRNSPGAADAFHREICPCTYLPRDFMPSSGDDCRRAREPWPFVQSAMHFFHCLLTCDRNVRKARLESFRQTRADPTSSTGIEARRSVYVRVLEKSVQCCACSDCIVSEATIYFPNFG